MNRTRITGTIAAVLVTMTTAGSVPMAALAWDDHHDGRSDQRHHRDDHYRDDKKHDHDRDNDRDRDRDRDRNHERDRYRGKDDNRQNTKNDWRNLATIAGGAAAVGLLTKDKTLTFVGAAGALYSLNRYEQDRKSQSNESRARYSIFSQPYFTRDGQRYDRETVTQNGQQYYRFRRH